MITPSGVARVPVASLTASPVRLRPISKASTRPDRTGSRHVWSLPECTRSWEDTPSAGAAIGGNSRDRATAPTSPRRTPAPPRGAPGPRPRPKILDARLAQAKAEAARLAGEQKTLLGRLRQIELAIETRGLERERTARQQGVAPTAVDAAQARVAAADAELAALTPEVRDSGSRASTS